MGTIIDFHAHAFPDGIAERAVASLEANTDNIMRAHTDGRASSLIESMKSAGVSKAVLCPIATKPSQLDGILDWCCSVACDELIPLASIHPDTDNPAASIEKIAARGLIGIKIHPMYQQFKLDDPKLNDLLAAAADNGLFVQSHCGYDVAYGTDDNADVDRIVRMLDRHPKLVFVATHLGGWKQWGEAVKELGCRENIWIETSASLAYMDKSQAVDVIRGFGTNRVVFGTDSPWFGHIEEIERIKNLKLTSEETEAILGKNAERFLSNYTI